MSLKIHPKFPLSHKKALTLSRKVDECRSLIPGGGRGAPGKALLNQPMKPNVESAWRLEQSV